MLGAPAPGAPGGMGIGGGAGGGAADMHGEYAGHAGRQVGKPLVPGAHAGRHTWPDQAR